MKFKEYLLEFSKHALPELISSLSIPLTNVLMKRLGYFQNDLEAYHLTNMRYLPEMVKNQNKKKNHISCFTKGGPELARLPSQPDILLKLEGDIVLEGKTDIWTVASERGVRWIDIKGSNDTPSRKKLLFYMKGVLQKTFDQFGIKIDIYKIHQFEIEDILFNLEKKEFTKFYNLYLRNVEEMLNQQYKYLNQYLKDAAEMKYNEVILDNWKILEVYSLPHNSEVNIKEKIEKLGLSYGGEITYKEIAKFKL